MSYSEQDNLVILTMSREDYEQLIDALGGATVVSMLKSGKCERLLGLLNRINSGNPHYTPYQVEK